MKTFLYFLLLMLLSGSALYAQTGTRKPAPRQPVRKTQPVVNPVAVARAKADSVRAVRELAQEMARQMVSDDSLKKAQAAATQLAEANRLKASQKNQAVLSTANKPTTRRPAAQPRRQPASRPQTGGSIGIGFRGSYNLNSLADYDSDGSVAGYYNAPGGALVVNIPFGTGLISLQAEPGYAERGVLVTQSGRMNNGIERYEDKSTIKLQYVEMPLLIRVQPKAGPLNLILTAGPEVRYLLGGSLSTARNEYNISSGQQVYSDMDVESIELNRVNRFDVGIVGGGGIGVPLSFGQVFADGRYHLGLIGIDSEDGTPMNRAISVNLGVVISLH